MLIHFHSDKNVRREYVSGIFIVIIFLNKPFENGSKDENNENCVCVR
jgi:hypothetical protein